MNKPQRGTLLIADITGYTHFLSESELEHAQEILTTLLDILVEHTRPPLVISRLAGDAVISYGLQGDFLQGQTLVELIEDTYVAFRRAINLLLLNNTCQCNACANVNTLDLKFFIHYGSFGLQHLSGHDELVGSDVNLIHRLLKNHVSEATGWRGYALYTEAAVQQLGLHDFQEKMTPHRESYEHLGEVAVWLQNLGPVWQEKVDQPAIAILPADRMIEVAAEIALPPTLLWDYLMDVEYRRILIGSDRQVVLDRKAGRIAAGSVYQCFHGDKVNLQTVLEWRPFERVVTEDLIDVPLPHLTVLVEYLLTATERGTRLVQSMSKPRGPLFTRLVARLVMLTMRQQAQRDIDEFKRRVEEVQAGKDRQKTTPLTQGD